MYKAHEFQTISTLMAEEERIDEETGEAYMEQIVIAENKKLRKTIDLFNIDSYEEYTKDKGSVYGKRTLLTVSGEPMVVAGSYDDIKALIEGLGVNGKKAGFGTDRDSKKT